MNINDLGVPRVLVHGLQRVSFPILELVNIDTSRAAHTFPFQMTECTASIKRIRQNTVANTSGQPTQGLRLLIFQG